LLRAEFHLKNDINGVIRTEQNEDHKKAFLYDQLTPKQKEIIDRSDSINDAPEASPAKQLQKLIDERIKKNNYKKNISDDKQKSQIEAIRKLDKG